MDCRDYDIFGINLLSSPGFIWLPTYLCWTSKHHTFDTIIHAFILSEPCISYFEPTYFIILHDFIPLFWLEEGYKSALSFFCRVFTCLWTLGSTSSMMVEPVSLLMYLWWCFHIDSWHVMSWLMCILDLESWLEFVWPIILVYVMHGLVWTFVDWDYMFSLHCHWAYPKCFVWWHFMSYVGHYLTQGHTIIFEFIRSFIDLVTTWYIS